MTFAYKEIQEALANFRTCKFHFYRHTILLWPVDTYFLLTCMSLRLIQVILETGW